MWNPLATVPYICDAVTMKLLMLFVCSGDLEELSRQTEDAVQRLKKAAEERRIKLDQCLQLRDLETKAAEVRKII